MMETSTPPLISGASEDPRSAFGDAAIGPRPETLGLPHLHKLIDHLPTAVFAKNPQGRFILWNRAAEALFGFTASQVAGKTHFDLFPEEQARFQEVVDRAVWENRESVRVESTIDSKILGPRVLRRTETAVFDAQGKPLYLLCVLEDITESRRSEQAVRESQERLDLALDCTVLGMWDWDVAAGEYVVDHRWAAILGYARNAVQPRVASVQQLIHPDDLQAVRSRVEDHLHGRSEFYESEHRMRTQSGHWLWVQEQGRASLCDSGGRVLRITGTLRDVTQRKDMESELAKTQSQLLQADKLASIGQLAAGVAHEINNPMGFISSNLNSLARYMDDVKRVLGAFDGLLQQGELLAALAMPAAEVRRLRDAADLDYILADLDNLIQESIEGADRVRQIVADLRDFSHVNNPHLAQEDLNDLLERTIHVAWNELKYKADVVRQYGQLPLIPCYGGKLGQVFLNLLVNAAQAIDRHGTITVRTGCDGDFAWIEVADTGQGIATENLHRIFDPFFTTKDVGKGTGLGLHLAYTTIRAHGGKIHVQSEPGQGATFRVELPVAGPPAEESSKAS